MDVEACSHQIVRLKSQYNVVIVGVRQKSNPNCVDGKAHGLYQRADRLHQCSGNRQLHLRCTIIILITWITRTCCCEPAGLMMMDDGERVSGTSRTASIPLHLITWHMSSLTLRQRSLATALDVGVHHLNGSMVTVAL